MPQLDFATYAPQLFWLAVTFILFYAMMVWLGLPRIGGVLAQRRSRIEGDLDRAAQMRSEAESVIAACEHTLSEARTEAQRTLRETTERLNAQAAERLRRATEALNAETVVAERRIGEARAAALSNVRSMSIELARAATTKLTGIDVDVNSTAIVVDAVLRERGDFISRQEP